MAKPLTRGQKAAETRKRNAASGQQAATAPMPVNLEKVFIAFTDGLHRLEKAILHSGYGSYPERDDAPNPAALGYAVPRITEVQPPNSNKASGQSAPVSVLIEDVHSRTAALRTCIEALRDSLVHGIYLDQPRATEASGLNNAASQGPSKDALNWAFSNLSASEALVEEIQRYLFNS